MRLDAPTFARAWLSVRQATATKDDAAVLSKTVAIEEYPRGVRLVSTDRFMLLTAWVPSLDAMSPREPGLDELPDRTVVTYDPDGRGKSLLGYVLTLARRMETDDLPDGALEVMVDFDVKIPAGDDVPETFEGLEPTYTVLTVPDTERVYLPVVEAEYPQWRHLVGQFHGESTAAIALSPELVGRVAGVARWCPASSLVVHFGGAEKVAAIDYPESDPHVTGLMMPRRWVLPGEPDPNEDCETCASGLCLRHAVGVVTVADLDGDADGGEDDAMEHLIEGVRAGRIVVGGGIDVGEAVDALIAGERNFVFENGTLRPESTPVEDPVDGGFDVARLRCPVCPTFVTVSSEDPDASFTEIVNHVRSHGFEPDDAAAEVTKANPDADRVDA